MPQIKPPMKQVKVRRPIVNNIKEDNETCGERKRYTLDVPSASNLTINKMGCPMNKMVLFFTS